MSPLRDTEFSRILLIKPTALGDVVHTVPTLVELRRRYPAAQIDWLVTPENAELVQHHPALSGVVLFDRRAFRKGLRAWTELPALLQTLRKARYDLAIDLHGQLRSAAFALATGAPVRIGFDRPGRRRETPSEHTPSRRVPTRGWAGAREGAWLAYTHRIPIPTLEVHAVDRYLWLGELLGFTPGPAEQTLHLAPEAIARAGQLLHKCGLGDAPFALLSPSTMWETKHWRAEGFAEVAQALIAEELEVVLVGGPGDRELSRRIQAACPQARDLTGQTSLGELAALVRRARLCVSNDSGVAHLAVAAGVPLAAIYGPTNPVTVGPYRRPESVVRLDLPCSPCNFRKLVQCPNGH
ncbi:MAG TPA: glycosyltransferase family 9 protein, partial [Chthoniobacteraceae bacterium]|nr:glycosyltransferase family 9 protein [Chthoniobacteraceae bacterium]